MVTLGLRSLSRSDLLARQTNTQSKMKFLIVFAAVVAVALAGVPLQRHITPPSSNNGDVVILRETPSNNIGLDGYNFAYELSDGQRRDEFAQVQPARSANEEATLRVTGSYSWVNPADGQTYTINYVADENGFQPQGAHLPVAPVA